MAAGAVRVVLEVIVAHVQMNPSIGQLGEDALVHVVKNRCREVVAVPAIIGVLVVGRRSRIL